jgi:hypothetical protein
MIGAFFTFSFGIIVEILQLLKIKFLGTTYDPLDIVMYGTGIILGLLVDYTIIDKFENQHNKLQ